MSFKLSRIDLSLNVEAYLHKSHLICKLITTV